MIDTAGPIEIVVGPNEIGYLRELGLRAVNSAVYRASKMIQSAAIEVVPFRTGELLDSLSVSVQGGDNPGVVLRLTAPYARTVEMGAPAHTIRAKGAHPLRFWWPRGPNGPGWYSYWKVEHPGYSGRGFVPRLRELAVKIIRNAIAEEYQYLRLRGKVPDVAY